MSETAGRMKGVEGEDSAFFSNKEAKDFFDEGEETTRGAPETSNPIEGADSPRGRMPHEGKG